MIWRAAAVWVALAGCAGAADLALPSTARLTVERNTDPDSFAAPFGPYQDDGIETVTVEGSVARSAYRLDASGLTPLQVIRPLREQLENDGFEIAFECGAIACGGFDFRFALEVLPAPNMYVNIRNYYLITAIRGDAAAPERVVTVLASTTSGSAYVQIIEAVANSTDLPNTPAKDSVTIARPIGDIGAALMETGHVVLEALDFETGTSALGSASFPALDALAAFLQDAPDTRIALVGHTDTVGGLEGNIALSRDRASAVRQRLIDAHNIAPGRIEARGMGYLAPIASNLTPEGRDANRRVEAVLLPAPQDD